MADFGSNILMQQAAMRQQGSESLFDRLYNLQRLAEEKRQFNTKMDYEKNKPQPFDLENTVVGALMKHQAGQPLSQTEMAAIGSYDMLKRSTPTPRTDPLTGVMSYVQPPRLMDMLGGGQVGGMGGGEQVSPVASSLLDYAAPSPPQGVPPGPLPPAAWQQMGGMEPVPATALEDTAMAYGPPSSPNAPQIPGAGAFRGSPNEQLEIGKANTRIKEDLVKQGVTRDQKRLEALQDASSSAVKAFEAIDTMRAQMPDIGYTGFGGEALGYMDKAFMDALPGKVEAREAFQKQGVDAWVSAVEPLKGALTEKEGVRFDKAVPSLNTTPQGIERLGRMTEALMFRQAQKSDYYQNWFQKNGNLRGADTAWAEFASKNPVITDEVINGTAGQPKITEGTTAINPQTGERIILRNGTWEALQ